jgi:hypothetical protein
MCDRNKSFTSALALGQLGCGKFNMREWRLPSLLVSVPAWVSASMSVRVSVALPLAPLFPECFWAWMCLTARDGLVSDVPVPA